MPNYIEVLGEAYTNAVAEKELSVIPQNVRNYVQSIVSKAEDNKGVIAVLTTLMTHKIIHPEQDIRKHQVQIEGGFGGRTIDKNYITPWLRDHSFPAMAESGWLTRSLEQPVPYDLNYTGKIMNVKNEFLQIVAYIEENIDAVKDLLQYFIGELIKKRDSATIDLSKPHTLPIQKIIQILEKHFTYNYSGSGAVRLPVLAIYAIYQCLMEESERYHGKNLLPLESHNSADAQSGRIGDIDIWEGNLAFEGVEVKHGIVITTDLIKHAYEKFKSYPTKRYYLLTTANMDSADWGEIEYEIDRINKIHGCQVIVNGVYSTINYYLRVICDPSKFIDNYVELLKQDRSVKYAHKEKWNEIIEKSE